MVFALIQFAIITFNNRRRKSAVKENMKKKFNKRMDRVRTSRLKQGDKFYDEVLFLRHTTLKEGDQAKRVQDEKSEEQDGGFNDPITFFLFLVVFVLFNGFYLSHYYEKRCI